MDLAVLIFLITFVVEALGWIGNDAISNFFYNGTLLLSSSPSPTQQRALKNEILKLRAELAATSSQDEFAKWAKLRRKLDGKVADLQSMSALEGGSRAAFASWFKRALWVLTTVLPFVVSSWHRKEAVFYLPSGWFGPAEWFMGLPSAPTGAIACGIWTMACKRSLGVIKDIVGEDWTGRRDASAAAAAKEGEEAAKVPLTQERKTEL